MARVKDVEILTVGTHQGHPYTEQDLDDIKKNFDDFSTGDKSFVKVPSVIGHEEDQPLTKFEILPQDNTGTPKVGTVSNLKKVKQRCRFCDGTKTLKLSDRTVRCPACNEEGNQIMLKGDITGVPRSIADIINARAYDKVSAEVYPEDNLPEGVPAQGKMLRRLSLLGGELPQIKSLSDLPMADYRDDEYEMSYGGPPVAMKLSEIRGVLCYSEIRKMNKNEMVNKLSSYGGSATMLNAMSEDMLSECMKMMHAHSEKFSEDSLMALSEKDAMTKLNEMGAKKFGKKFKAYVESPHADDKRLRDIPDDDTKDNQEHSKDLEDDMHKNAEKVTPTAGMKTEKNSEDDKKKDDDEEDDGDADDTEKNSELHLHKHEHKHDHDHEHEHDHDHDHKHDEEHDHEHKHDHDHAHKHSEQRKLMTFSEIKPQVTALVEEIVKGVLNKVTPIEERVARQEKLTKEKEIDQFCEKYLMSGHIASYEMDTSSNLPTLKDRLMKLDDAKPIHKFGEKNLTQLQIEMEAIKARQPVDFREKIQVPKEVMAKSQDAMLAHVERFCEEQSKVLEKASFKKDDILKMWKDPKTSDKDRAEFIKGVSPEAFQKFSEMGCFRSLQTV